VTDKSYAKNYVKKATRIPLYLYRQSQRKRHD
jgi:hypothetical protein